MICSFLKKLFLILGLVSCFVCNAQSEIDFKSINDLGKAFTAKLRAGDLRSFKNSKPPKDTWTYERLLEYKKDLNNPDVNISFGNFIGPSTNKTIFAYNLFAYKKSVNGDYEYYYAAIVSIDVSNEKPKIENAFLFTEKDALKSWWKHVFGLYHTKTIETIPDKYYNPICPPPPFKK